eukprot:PLAT9142.1.p1 GENE.PLAT9142.1~~PLAT9142.1.p1  ORF type:complete len:927 (+),score=380.70 PLAT9142.1:17-2797(+)
MDGRDGRAASRWRSAGSRLSRGRSAADQQCNLYVLDAPLSRGALTARAGNVCGTVVKKGDVFGRWHSRFFVLDPRAKTASYYADDTGAKGPRATMDLTGAQLKPSGTEMQKGMTVHAFQVYFVGPSKTFTLGTDSDVLTRNWLDAFRRVISGEPIVPEHSRVDVHRPAASSAERIPPSPKSASPARSSPSSPALASAVATAAAMTASSGAASGSGRAAGIEHDVLSLPPSADSPARSSSSQLGSVGARAASALGSYSRLPGVPIGRMAESSLVGFRELLSTAHALAGGSSAWTLAEATGSGRIFTPGAAGAPSSHAGAVQVASVMLLPVTPGEAFKFLADSSQRGKWDSQLDSVCHLMARKRTDILHLTLRPLWLPPLRFPARDFVVNRRWQRFTDGSFAMLEQSTDSELAGKPAPGCVRGSLPCSGFVIRNGPAGGPPSCVLVMYTCVSFAGWLRGPLATAAAMAWHRAMAGLPFALSLVGLKLTPLRLTSASAARMRTWSVVERDAKAASTAASAAASAAALAHDVEEEEKAAAAAVGGVVGSSRPASTDDDLVHVASAGEESKSSGELIGWCDVWAPRDADSCGFTLLRGVERNSSGGLTFVDAEQIARQKGVVSHLLRSMGSNLMEGKSLINISLPVNIFEARSYLQRMTDNWSFASIYLPKASDADTPLRRLQYVMTFIVAGLHLNTRQQKPFNPILGETYQATIGDAELFCEQTAHHPPVSHFQLRHDKFHFYGYYEYLAGYKTNALKGQQRGDNFVAFPDGGKVWFEMPYQLISGTMWGDRRIEWHGSMNFRDEANDLTCELRFNPEEWRGSFFSKAERPTDAFRGDIMQAGSKVSYCEGSWLGSIEFDGEVFWDMESVPPVFAMPISSPLPSDCRFRSDLQSLKAGDLDAAADEKSRLENVQRRDRKLRKEGGKSSGH